MVYKSLEITDSKNNSTGKLTEDQIEAIIDMLTRHINSRGGKKGDDNWLDGLNMIIGLYDADKENVKKLFFKDKKTSEEKVEDKLNDLVSVNDETKIIWYWNTKLNIY